MVTLRRDSDEQLREVRNDVYDYNAFPVNLESREAVSQVFDLGIPDREEREEWALRFDNLNSKFNLPQEEERAEWAARVDKFNEALSKFPTNEDIKERVNEVTNALNHLNYTHSSIDAKFGFLNGGPIQGALSSLKGIASKANLEWAQPAYKGGMKSQIDVLIVASILTASFAHNSGKKVSTIAVEAASVIYLCSRLDVEQMHMLMFLIPVVLRGHIQDIIEMAARGFHPEEEDYHRVAKNIGAVYWKQRRSYVRVPAWIHEKYESFSSEKMAQKFLNTVLTNGNWLRSRGFVQKMFDMDQKYEDNVRHNFLVEGLEKQTSVYLPDNGEDISDLPKPESEMWRGRKHNEHLLALTKYYLKYCRRLGKLPDLSVPIEHNMEALQAYEKRDEGNSEETLDSLKEMGFEINPEGLPMKEVESQMDFSFTDFGLDEAMEGISNIICAVLGSSIAISSRSKTSIFREVNDMFRVKKNISEMLSSIGEFFKKITHILYLNGCGFLGSLVAPSGKTEFEEFLTDFQTLFDRFQKQHLLMSPENLSKFENLKSRGEAIFVSMNKDRASYNSSRLLEKYLTAVDKIIQQFHDSKISVSGMRQEPVSILIQGKPAQYKSTLSNYLNLDCARLCLPKEDHGSLMENHARYIYNRQAETEYWDSYREDMPVCYFDDMGQVRDQIGDADGEYMNVIRAINSAPYMLHRADVASKGKTYFRSKFVIATTNLEKFKPAAIVCHEALERRFQIVLKMIPKPEYEDAYKPGFVDLEKVPKSGRNNAKLTPDVWLYSVKEGSSWTEISYQDLLIRIQASYLEKKSIFEDYLDNFKEHVNLHPLDTSESVLNRSPCSVESKDVTDMGGFEVQFPLQAHLIESQGVDVRNSKLRAKIAQLGANKPKSNRNVLFDYNEELYGKEARDMFHDTINEFSVSAEILCHNLLRHNPCKPDIMAYPPLFVAEQLFNFSPVEFLNYVEGDNGAISTFNSFELKCPTLVCDRSKFSFIESSKKILSDLKSWTNYIQFPELSASMKYLSLGAVGLVLISSLASLFGGRKEDDEKFIIVDGEQESQGQYWKGGTSKAKNKPKVLSRQLLKSQMGDLGYTIDFQKRIGTHHVFSFYLPRSNKRHHGYLVGLEDNIFLCPAHYLYKYKCLLDDGEIDEKERIIINQRDQQAVTMTIKEFLDSDISSDELLAKDCAVLILPTLSRTRSIKKHFLSESELDKLPVLFNACWYDPDSQAYRESRAQRNDKEQIIDRSSKDSYVVVDSFWYKAQGKPGWCGLPIMARIKGGNITKILGFHIAGYKDECAAISNLITREMIERSIDEYVENDGSKLIHSDIGDLVASSQGTEFEVQRRFEKLGTVKIPHSPYGVTKIRASPLQEVEGFETSQGVAYRLKSDERDPFDVALQKYAINEINYEYSEYLDRAVEDVRNHLRNFNEKPLGTRILTLEESLWGIEGEETWDAINSSSSPGYPLNKTSKLKNRLFAVGAPRDSSNESFGDIKSLVSEVVRNANNNVRMMWIFTDNLKDERYPLEKIRKGKVRLFNGSPFVYFVTFRMYFGAFSSWFIKNRLKNEACVGINEKSYEWSVIAEKLLTTSPTGKVGAGDYSGYDGSEKPDIHWAILEFIQEFYDDGPENAKIRRILWLELTNSRHIFNDVVYEWKSSLPSGHPLTIIVNCIYNMIAFRYVYFRSVGIDAPAFRSKVCLFVLGDDNLWSVDPEIGEKMNERSVPDYMGELGLVYTTENKLENVTKDFRDIKEVEFLKRGFIWDKSMGFWIAPLRREVVEEIPMWSKKGPLYFDIFIDNIRTSLEEASLHDKNWYKHYQVKISQAFDVLGIDSSSVGFPIFRNQLERKVDVYGDRRALRDLVRENGARKLKDATLLHPAVGKNNPKPRMD